MTKRKRRAEARAKAKAVTKPVQFRAWSQVRARSKLQRQPIPVSFFRGLKTLREPILLKYEDDGRAAWEKPSNLHDKIVLFVYRRRFSEYLAKWQYGE